LEAHDAKLKRSKPRGTLRKEKERKLHKHQVKITAAERPDDAMTIRRAGIATVTQKKNFSLDFKKNA